MFDIRITAADEVYERARAVFRNGRRAGMAPPLMSITMCPKASKPSNGMFTFVEDSVFSIAGVLRSRSSRVIGTSSFVCYHPGPRARMHSILLGLFLFFQQTPPPELDTVLQ